MRVLPLSAVARWTTVHGRWAPQSIDTICPRCDRMVNLSLQDYGLTHETMLANARCPACGEGSRVYALDPGAARDASKRSCALLAIHPDPRPEREPIIPGDRIGHPALARAYGAAIQSYNAGLWDPCATSCRKTLEGILHTLLPESARKGSLFEQLQRLPGQMDLAQPLVALADSLRKAGNVAAHFNLEQKPDPLVAELMLDLLDYLLEYVYVLKDKARDLERRFGTVREDENTTEGI